MTPKGFERTTGLETWYSCQQCIFRVIKIISTENGGFTSLDVEVLPLPTNQSTIEQ